MPARAAPRLCRQSRLSRRSPSRFARPLRAPADPRAPEGRRTSGFRRRRGRSPLRRRRRRVDADGRARMSRLIRARDLQRKDDAERAVQPAAIGHAVGMRASEQGDLGVRRAAIHVADPSTVASSPASAIRPRSHSRAAISASVKAGRLTPVPSCRMCKLAKVLNRTILVQSFHCNAPALLFPPIGASTMRRKIVFRIQN